MYLIDYIKLLNYSFIYEAFSRHKTNKGGQKALVKKKVYVPSESNVTLHDWVRTTEEINLIFGHSFVDSWFISW